MSLLSTDISKRRRLSLKGAELPTVEPPAPEAAQEIAPKLPAPGLIKITVSGNEQACYFEVAGAVLKYHIHTGEIELGLCLDEAINQHNKDYFNANQPAIRQEINALIAPVRVAV